jgi:hypothetical protein
METIKSPDLNDLASERMYELLLQEELNRVVARAKLFGLRNPNEPLPPSRWAIASGERQRKINRKYFAAQLSRKGK